MKDAIDKLLCKIPGYEAAKQAVRDESINSRAALIHQIRGHQERADRAEAEFVANSSALDARAKKLGMQLAGVQLEIAENLSARAATRFAADAAIGELRRQLRSDVQEQVSNFQACIVRTRQLLQSDFGNSRSWVLGANNERPHTDAQVVSALALLLKIYVELDRVAVGEADVEAAIATMRERLNEASIQLVDRNTLLHSVPPLQKAQAYL